MDTGPAVHEIPGDPDRLIMHAIFPQFTSHELFDYCTRPALLERWWPPRAVVDPREGGVYRLSWPEMNWHLYGTFTHFEPGQRLGYTWRWEHDAAMPTRHVEITFVESTPGSELTLIHSAYGDDTRDQEDRQNHLDGWMHFLAQLHGLAR